jgi:hypothetical protein
MKQINAAKAATTTKIAVLPSNIFMNALEAHSIVFGMKTTSDVNDDIKS